MMRAPLGLIPAIVLTLAAPASADREAIETVLNAMETAVLGADIDGYLSHVATDEPVFVVEQQNWAKDLTAHTPMAFELSIVDPDPDEADNDEPVQRFDDDRAVFDLRTDWQMTEKSAPRSVTFPVVFTVDETSGAWQYAGEAWTTIGGGANRVLCYEGYESAAELALELLPDIREHVDELFDNRIDTAQTVKIYPAMKHLQHSIYLSYVDGLAGWNEPNESIKLLHSRRRTRSGMRTLLAHEYGHVATFALGPKSTDIPWWALEGVAELCTLRYMRRKDGVDRFIERVASQRELPAWEDLSDFRSVRPNDQPFVYAQGLHMVQYLTREYGDENRNAWFRAMAQGASLDEATREVYGRSFESIDEAYRDQVALSVNGGV